MNENTVHVGYQHTRILADLVADTEVYIERDIWILIT